MAGKGWSNPGGIPSRLVNTDLSQVRHRCIKKKLEARAARANNPITGWTFILFTLLCFAVFSSLMHCSSRSCPCKWSPFLFQNCSSWCVYFRKDDLGSLDGNANYHGGNRALRFQADGPCSFIYFALASAVSILLNPPMH